jgi:hypothetical protein
MVIAPLISALDAACIPYAIAGGMALNVHGIPRLNYDIALIVPLVPDVLASLEGALRGLGLRPHPAVVLEQLSNGAERERLLTEFARMTVTFTDPDDPLREVDVFVNPPVDPGGVVSRAETWRFADQPVCICSRADLSDLSFQDLPDQSRLSAYETMSDEAKLFWLEAWQAVMREFAAPVPAEVFERRARPQPLMPPKRSSPRRVSPPKERDSIREQLSVTQEEQPRRRRRTKPAAE